MIGVTFDSPKENFREYGFLSVVQQSEVSACLLQAGFRAFQAHLSVLFWAVSCNAKGYSDRARLDFHYGVEGSERVSFTFLIQGVYRPLTVNNKFVSVSAVR